MNLIEAKFIESGLKYKSNFEVSKLTNIVAHEQQKNCNQYYKWYATYENIVYPINLTRNKTFLIDVFCNECDKIIKKDARLSSMFTFSICCESNLKYSESFSVRCKKCSSRKNGSETVQKGVNTRLQRYGCAYTFQMPNYARDAHITKTLKYGVDYKKICSKKGQKRYFDKTGYNHNMKNPECVNVHKQKRKQTILNWTPERKTEINTKRLLSYQKESSDGLFGKKSKNPRSKISIDFYEQFYKATDYSICIEEQIGRYIVDFLIPNMCIIEFYGTFWHADPRKYKAGDILKRGNSEKYHVTAQEVWQKDYERITELVENTKLPCIIVWENDYRKNKGATIQTVLQKIIKFKNIHLAQNEQRTNSI